jgi:dTDP-4-amino-4,6-dideoxygalactose transaminase
MKLAVDESPLRYVAESSKKDSTSRSLGRVAAIMPVHQMGMPCDLESIVSLARQFDIPVVEDAACAIGSEVGIADRWERIGKPHGDIACFSFHPRKIVATGDGGMLTTAQAYYDAKVRLLRQHAMTVPDTVRHAAREVIFEEYVATGYNYRMTDVQAAIGIEQLKRLPGFLEDRTKLADMYRAALRGIPWLRLPVQPSFARTNWQSYPVKVLPAAPVTRDALMQRLLDAGIASRRGIMNAHQERPYRNGHHQLPCSEEARDAVLLLPLYSGMTHVEIETVINAISHG